MNLFDTAALADIVRIAVFVLGYASVVVCLALMLAAPGPLAAIGVVGIDAWMLTGAVVGPWWLRVVCLTTAVIVTAGATASFGLAESLEDDCEAGPTHTARPLPR